MVASSSFAEWPTFGTMPASGLPSGMHRLYIGQPSSRKRCWRSSSKCSYPRYNSTVQDIKLVVVRSCGSRAEAELAKGALEEAGIEAIIQADTAGGMREHLAWSGAGFKILVREDEAIAARDVLVSLVAGGESPDADSQTDDDSFPPWRRMT